MLLNSVQIVSNPVGGSHRQATVDALVARLNKQGITANITSTTPAADSAEQLTLQAVADDVDLVIAMGGDGTARGVASALINKDTPMAVYPGGTGNVFARNYYARPTSDAFVDMLLQGQPQPVDLCKYTAITDDGKEESGVFLVGLAFGPLADAISGTGRRAKRLFGVLAYIGNMARATIRPRRVQAKITCVADPTRVIEQPIAIAGALNVVPHMVPFLSRGCTAHDGRLDIVAVQADRSRHVLAVAAALARMRPDQSPYYARLRAQEFEVRTNKPVSLNIDGDVGPTTSDFHLSVLPEAVQMILA